MASKCIGIGTNGQRVAANVRRLREAQGLSLRALSLRLKEVGHPLLIDAVGKIENGARSDAQHTRRVDVDDLVGLSKALGVTPTQLLAPPESLRITVQVSTEEAGDE